jgi:hypothetical protein
LGALSVTKYSPDDHFKTPAERRAFLIYYAKVMLRESAARRGRGAFHWTLLEWAQKARRQAATIDLRPAQRDLFG